MTKEGIREHELNCFRAVRDGMDVVFETLIKSPKDRELGVQLKNNKTLVTAVDKQVARIMTRHVPKDHSLIIEDGEDRTTDSDFIYIADPLDGTGAFAAGLPTPTVIMAVYDKKQKQLICSAAGIPATGQIWTASQENPTELTLLRGNGVGQVKTWTGGMNRKTVVFLDVSHGFPNKIDGGNIFDNRQMRELINDLTKETKVLIPGSNILMQCMIANGGYGAVGSIMTAKGGPQDMCAVLQVLQAGGEAVAFRAAGGKFRRADPLDVLNGNILICANNADTLEQLEDIVSCQFQDL